MSIISQLKINKYGRKKNSFQACATSSQGKSYHSLFFLSFTLSCTDEKKISWHELRVKTSYFVKYR